jgi:hypothetical protein
MTKSLPLLALAIAIVATPLSAAETRSRVEGVAAPAANIADLGWLAGHWVGKGLGGRATEVYSAPAGGQIVGHFGSQDKDGSVRFYELMTIAAKGNSLTYRIKHFNPDMTGWEAKDTFVSFDLVATEPHVWYFDGMTIRRTAADAMTVTVLIHPDSGKTFEAPFTYRRQKH